jgi:tetratricopeptide (TPR) repeat protein
LIGCAPKTSTDFYKLALRQCHHKKTFQTAMTNFKKAIELDSNNALAYIALGSWKMNQYNLIDIHDARNYFIKAHTIDTTDSYYLYLIAYTYVQEGTYKYHTVYVENLKEAIPYLDKAISLNDKDNLYFYERYLCYSYIGDTVKANIDLRKSCELKNPVACMILNGDLKKK